MVTDSTRKNEKGIKTLFLKTGTDVRASECLTEDAGCPSVRHNAANFKR